MSSSDLADPTPFLLEQQFILTTGLQFAGFPDADYDVYVGRLQDCGALGIGFGTEAVSTGTPLPLIDACRARGFALVEVPFEVLS